MYKAFFGFEETPFASKPDPGFFFRGNEHDASLRGLIFAVQARMGLISLTGEKGTGKTTVLECLRESLESDNIPCAFIRDPRISVDEFFRTIASDLDLQCQGGASAYKVFSALSQLMAQQTRRGRTVALIVDDAHNLPADVFNEIIHIASLHDDKAKLIQTIFAGRPELLPMLHKLNLERLKQPTILSRTLHPFELQETKQYIEFRLARAGMPKQTIFSTEAMEEIHDLSHGFPPAIHEVCERLLLAAFAESSQVCTEQILSQVFNRQPRNPANIVEAPASLVVPPPMGTTLLRLTFTALPISPLPLRMSAFDPFQFTSLQPLFPGWSTALSVGEFPLGSATPMWLTNAAEAASVPNLSIGSVPFAHSLPRHPAFTALEICGVAEHHFPDSPLIPLGCYIKSKSPLFSAAAAANVSSVPYASALLPLRPVATLLPAGMIRLPHVPVTPFRAAKNSPQSRRTANDAQPSILSAATLLPTRPVASLQPSGIMQSPCVPLTPFRVAKHSPPPPRAAKNVQFEKHTPAIAGGLTASHNLLPLASRVPLPPCDTYVKPGGPLAWAAAGAHLFSMPGVAPLQPIHPAVNLRPSATICWPRVPVIPFQRAEQDRTLSTAGKGMRVQITPAELTPTMPASAPELSALREPNIRQQNRPLPLISSVLPSPPLPALPVKPALHTVTSLMAWPPASKLIPVDPLSPDFLLRRAWTPAATRPEAPFQPKVSRTIPTVLRTRLLALAIPLLAGIAVYGTPPAASALTQGWRRTQQAVLDRAAIALDEDFRSGLKSWTNGAGASPSWTSDAAGFVHPGAIALYRPSLGLVDYQMQFLGMIDKKSLSWVVRAADFKNYYAIRLTVLKPGPIPTIGVTRYAVIDGKTQNRVTTPLVMRAQADTVYRVRLDVRGDRFALWVQDQQVDSWSQPNLGQGGIGFFSAQDSASRVSGVQVRGQYDTLGRLCAFLVPAGQSPDARP